MGRVGTEKETMVKTLPWGRFFHRIKAANAEKIAATAQQFVCRGLTVVNRFDILQIVSLD